MIKKWADPARARFGAAFRTDCLLCGAAADRAVCPGCERGLEAPPGPGDFAELDSVVVAYAYRFPLDRLVQRFKAGGDFAAGCWLAERLAEHVAGEPQPDLVVAPPTPRARLVARGLNPALHLARRVARSRGLRCDGSRLARAIDTPPQRGLDREARRANVLGAFRCRTRVDGLRVAIVDDVVTTGATAAELARVLRDAGATRVDLWAVARTPAPEEG